MENVENIWYEKINIVFVSFFVFGVFLFVAYKLGYFNLNRETVSKTHLRGKNVLFAFFIFLGLQIFILPFLLHLLLSLFGDPILKDSLKKQWSGWYNISAIFLTFLGLLSYLKKLPLDKKIVVWGSFAFRGVKAKLEDFFVACSSWLLSYPLVMAIGQLVSLVVIAFYQYVQPQQVAVDQIKKAANSTMEFAALVFSVVVLVPFIEELLFRGFLQNWLKNRLSKINAVLLTSAIFSIFHFAPSQGVGNIELIVSLFVLSCFLGYIYERQKSLFAPIFMHSIFNMVSIILIIVTKT